MKVLIATDFRLYKVKDKLYLNDTTYTTVERYKKIFGNIILCTRVVYCNEANSKMKDATVVLDEYVEIEKLVDTLFGKNNTKIKQYVEDVDLVIARVPSIIAYKVANISHFLHKPVLALAMGCAWGTYWNHSIPGKLIAPYMYLEMKRVMQQSNYALYVTSEFLQKRYPCRCKINIGVSDVKIVDLNATILKRRIKKIENKSCDNDILVMTIGDVASRIKGQIYTIKAIKMLKDEGIIVHYLLVGEGDRSLLVNIANKLGVANQLVFTGRLNTNEVNEYLDKADIYIQPSLQEGLPRAVVEAMGRGCPVIASKVGGIPELIEAKYLVEPKSSKEIYNKIKVMLEKEQMLEQARRNFEKAKEFENILLSNRRNKFFELVKQDMMKDRIIK